MLWFRGTNEEKGKEKVYVCPGVLQQAKVVGIKVGGPEPAERGEI